MGQHYVPKYYLNGFTGLSDSPYIYVYEKGAKEILRTNIKNVANENRRWSEKVEKYLSNQIEIPAQPVFEKIRNRRSITQNDKNILSAYMVVLIERVPKAQQRIKANFPKIREKTYKDLEIEIQRLIEQNPTKSNILEHNLQLLQSIMKTDFDEFPMENWYEHLNPNILPGVYKILPTMTWTFLKTNTSLSFLTSDNPVFFFEWLGIGRPESELTFPISSDICLLATWARVKEGYITTTEAIIKEINRRSASSATRYVYYSAENSGVSNLINRKNWKFKRIALSPK